jgi:hypothetical protein
MKSLFKNPKNQPLFKNFNELRWAIFLELQGYQYYYEGGDFIIDGAKGKIITLQVVEDINNLKSLHLDTQQEFNVVVDGFPFFKSTDNEYSIAIGKVIVNPDHEEFDEKDAYWSDLCIKNEFDLSSYYSIWDGMFKEDTERKDFAEDGDACIDILKENGKKHLTLLNLLIKF